MEGLAQSRYAGRFLYFMTFPAADLFAFYVYKPAGFIIRGMVTHAAAAFFQAFGVAFMGKADWRASEFAKDILMSQNVVGFLGH